MPRIINEEVIHCITESIHDVVAIYHFGSSAIDQEHLDSDVDLAILTTKKADPTTLYKLREKCSQILKKNVDIAYLNGATPVFVMQVLESGHVIYCQNQKTLAYFEIRMMSEYCDLNLERREIIKDIIKRGSVYG